MEVDSNSTGKMVNLSKSDRYEEGIKASFCDGSRQQNLIMNSHRLGSGIEMDLNDLLLGFLNRHVTCDKLRNVERLLLKGADPNTVDIYGNRLIHLAILKSPHNSVLVQKLIDFGADVNAVNYSGTTPLMSALQNRLPRTTKMLIKKGVYLNFQCQRGVSGLMISSMVGDYESVTLLLKHGANVNACDTGKKTALMYAVSGNYPKVIKALLAYGANPAMCDAYHQTALDIYLEKNYPDLDVVNELLKHCAVLAWNTQDSFKRVMKICLRGSPPYHPSVQTLIKIQMLLTNNHRSVSEFENFYYFANDCCSEIRYMGQHRVSRYRDVTKLLQMSLEGIMPKESELEGLLTYMANNYFPIYSDMLRARLRKSFLRKKFMTLLMYAKRNGDKDEIILNSHVNLKLESYLSDDDMTNFVFAAYLKTKK